VTLRYKTIKKVTTTTIKALLTCAWLAGGPNLRLGQSLPGERWRGAGLREGAGEIICLKIRLIRGNRRANANFDSILKVLRITEASTANDGGNCRL